MTDLIIIAGAPGSGKSTVGKILRDKLRSPFIELWMLREMHLDENWTAANTTEERMSVEHLIYLIRNYQKHGYRPVVVTDLKDEGVEELVKTFHPNITLKIFTLYVSDESELTRRIMDETRTSGYRRVTEALQRNRTISERPRYVNEYIIDNTNLSIEETVSTVISLLDAS